MVTKRTTKIECGKIDFWGHKIYTTGCAFQRADVVELADTHDSKSCAARHVGSIPTIGTTTKKLYFSFRFVYKYRV